MTYPNGKNESLKPPLTYYNYTDELLECFGLCISVHFKLLSNKTSVDENLINISNLINNLPDNFP